MADIHEGERARRLAIIVGAERDVALAARNAYAELLAAIAADVLNDVAIVAAIRDPNRGRNQAAALWSKLTRGITQRLGDLFAKRFRRTGASDDAMGTPMRKFFDGVESRLASVPNEVYGALNTVIDDGLKAGLSQSVIEDQLRAELTPGHDAYEARLNIVSHTIARTTTTAAFNAGDQAGFSAQEVGSGTTKRWLSSHDTHVRPTHVLADDDPVNQAVPVGEWFTVGGFSALFPGDWTLPPQESVNCRCTALYSRNGSLVASHSNGDSAMSGLPNGFRGPIAALDVPTGDRRQLETPEGGVKTREYPLSLTMNHVGDPTGYPVIGHLDRVWTQDGLLYGEGPFDLGGEAGMNAARQLHEGHMNTVSIDPDMVKAAVNRYDKDGNLIDQIQLSSEETEHFRLSKSPFVMNQLRALRGEQLCSDEAALATEVDSYVLAFTDWRLAGLAMVPIPAYTQARIEPVYDYSGPGKPTKQDAIVAAATEELTGTDRSFLTSMIAHHDEGIMMAQHYLSRDGAQSAGAKSIAQNIVSTQTAQVGQMHRLLADSAIVAAVGGQVFNAAFFGDPKFEGPTPMTIDENGHVYGHVREHGTCYQHGGGAGDGGFCLEPPDSACSYAKFETHGAKLDDGRTIRVGALTFGDGHYSAGSLKASREHYNNVATIAAKVNAGTDAFGVWVNGQVVDEYADKAYDLLLSPLSGHWEPDADNNGHLEMIAAHIVVTPGYTVRRIVAGFDDAGQPNSLIITTPPVQRAVPAQEAASTMSARALAVQAINDLKRAEALAARINAGTQSAAERMAATEAIIASMGDAPISPTSTPWDGGAAAGQILDHATSNGKIDVGKASQGFLAHVGDGSKRGDWKLPIANVTGGVLHIIPRGVSAAAGRLNQTQGINQKAAGSKICGLYSRIRKMDPTWPACPVGK